MRRLTRRRRSAVVADRAERGTSFLVYVAGGLKVVCEDLLDGRVQRNIPHLGSLSVHAQMRDATALVDVVHAQIREFGRWLVPLDRLGTFNRSGP
jgi:hypothetical protein